MAKSRTPSEHLNPDKIGLKWVVHLPQNGTIGFDPQPYEYLINHKSPLTCFAECLSTRSRVAICAYVPSPLPSVMTDSQYLMAVWCACPMSSPDYAKR